MCGDVVYAIYGNETISGDEMPTQQTATATSQVGAADSRMTSTVAKSVELNLSLIHI